MSTTSSVGQLVDTTSFVSSFPHISGTEILRDNILQTLERMLDGKGISSVHIDGVSGAGKTVLLAQFAKRYSSRTISLFLKRSSWFTFDPDFLLQDLAAQMYWLLERKDLKLEHGVDDTLMRRLVYGLRSYSSRIGKPIVLILDGLAEIPEEQRDLKDLLISRLPLGLDYIKLLTSASTKEFGKLQGAKEWPVPLFSGEETASYFATLLSADGVRTVHATCNGIPGYLSSIKRLLESGKDEAALLAEMPDNAPELFQLEWQVVNQSNTALLRCLALLAHDSNSHTLEGLAKLAGIETEILKQCLRPLRFIKLPLKDFEPVEFVSDPFRQFVAKRLAAYKDEVNQLMIDVLSKNEDGDEALALLPSYLRQAGDDARLLAYLSPDRFAKILNSSHQISPVRQKVLLGFETASEVSNHSEMLRFAVQSSALSEYSGFTVSRSEIAARMELQDVASCVALAQAAVLLNDRLRLFAAIGRIRCERGESLEPDFTTELETLFAKAEWTEFHKEALNQLASDLVFIKPELATLALEKATPNAKDNSTRLDIAIANASLIAESSGDQAMMENAQRLRSKIKNPRFLSLFNAISGLMRDVDAEAVVERTRQLGTPKEQLFFLKQWSVHARATIGVAKVTSYALDLAIRTTEYTPTATDLRELAETFRRIPADSVSDLVKRFDAQRAAVEAIGPTNDFMYLQLLIALGESKGDKEAAGNRLVDIFAAISQLRDLAVKTACLARLLDMLPLIDPSGAIRKREGIEDLAFADFKQSLSDLLGATAEHKHATRDIIAALANRYPDDALAVAMSANTSSRRDEALSWLVECLLKLREEELSLTTIEKVCKSFRDRDDVETSITRVLDRLSEIVNISDLHRHCSAIVYCAGEVLKFHDEELQVRASCAALVCLLRLNQPSLVGLISILRRKMEDVWNDIDAGAEKMNVAFHVSSKLAKLDREQASTWLTMAESCQSTQTAITQSEQYRHCLFLVSRGYAGLVQQRLDNEEDLNELERKIGRIASVSEKLGLWIDVALRLLKCERLREARQIGTDQIQKLIAYFKEGSVDRFRAIAVSLPVLFHTSKATAIDLLAELPATWRDVAIAYICNYLCKKLPSWDPYEAAYGQVYELTIDEILAMCDLAERADADSIAFWIISTICNYLRSKASKRTITGNQRADIIVRLTNISVTKFPNPQFIQHAGYRILCQAEIALLGRYSRTTWETILADALAIPNTADRCLVTTLVAGKIAKHDTSWATEIFDKCELEARTIPSALDRAGRFHTMAREAYNLNKSLSKKYYQQALMMTVDGAHADYDAVRKDIIDSAYQVNPELAASLASAMDSDQARRVKRAVSSRIEILEIRRQLAANTSVDKLPDSAKAKLPQASWELLGSLNSHRVVPIKVQQTRPYIVHAAGLPFRMAFPVYAYVIENASERIRDRAEALRILRGGYRALSTAADLFYFLAERTIHVSPLPLAAPLLSSGDSCFVDAGERSRGLSFIEKWLARLTGEVLNVSDPFFSPTELVELLKMVLLVNPSLEINVITSKVGLLRGHVAMPFADSFSKAWKDASSQDPPIVRVIVVAVGAEGYPLIHDRWWCCGTSALELGTSFNGIGIGKSTKISVMSAEECTQASDRLSKAASMTRKFVDGQRVVYESFDLYMKNATVIDDAEHNKEQKIDGAGFAYHP